MDRIKNINQPRTKELKLGIGWDSEDLPKVCFLSYPGFPIHALKNISIPGGLYAF